MAEASETITISTRKIPRWVKILIGLGLSSVVIFLLWYFFYPRVDMKKIHELIVAQSSNYTDPAGVEVILLQGVKEIRWDRNMYLQAKAYSKSTNLPLEQVIVDTAVSTAKQLGYIS